MNHPLQAARRCKWPAWIAGILVSAAPLASAGIAAVNTGFLNDTVDRTSDTKSFDASGGGNPVMNARLTPAVRSTIQANMRRWLRTRSTLAVAQGSEWIIHDSENHDAMQKGSHLLCLLALKNAEGYGPGMVLADGGTLAANLQAWTACFIRYLRVRAKQGINVEIASPIHAKYSVGTYYIVVQRDPNASQHGNSTLVFVSTNAWNSRVETGGWFFTQRGNAYCAIKPAGGGYELQLGDMWAPVIVQMGQAGDYTDFAAFQTSVMANALTDSSGTMNYTSEAGDTFSFYANTKTTPRVNGTTVNLNPAKTYHSPYLSLVHGEEIATVSDPGRPDLIVQLPDAADDDDLVLRPNSSAKGLNRVSRFPDKPSSRNPIPSP
jgi:hypothetical protein